MYYVCLYVCVYIYIFLTVRGDELRYFTGPQYSLGWETLSCRTCCQHTSPMKDLHFGIMVFHVRFVIKVKAGACGLVGRHRRGRQNTLLIFSVEDQHQHPHRRESLKSHERFEVLTAVRMLRCSGLWCHVDSVCLPASVHGVKTRVSYFFQDPTNFTEVKMNMCYMSFDLWWRSFIILHFCVNAWFRGYRI
jgi:hypothetical protein